MTADWVGGLSTLAVEFGDFDYDREYDGDRDRVRRAGQPVAALGPAAATRCGPGCRPAAERAPDPTTPAR